MNCWRLDSRPEKMHKISPFILRFLVPGIFSACVGAYAQAPPPLPVPPKDKKAAVQRANRKPAEPLASEKAIAADANISIKFCVSEGKLSVNGWDRGEVRVFGKSGREFEFRVLEKDKTSGKPNWLWIVAKGGDERREDTSECLLSESIEMDVPEGASLNITGRSITVKIDSVKRANVKNVEGNILIRNTEGGIAAATYHGNITVENSAGAISLDSAAGNIAAFKVEPGQVGDIFKAKSNSGAISIQKVSHRQIEASSVTGSVFFDGAFLAGGIYNFKTSNGAVKMLIPLDSACKVTANYGFGSFNSNLPLKFIYRNENDRARSLSALLGSGESCSLNLTTNSGTIALNKN